VTVETSPLAATPYRRAVIGLLGLVVAGTAAYVASMVVPGLRTGTGAVALWDSWVYDGVFVLASLACAARALLVRHERWAWAALAAAMACTTGGELYWAFHLTGLDVLPYPSPADALYIAFYPLAYLAVALLVRSRVRDLRGGMWLDGLVCGLAPASIAAALGFDTIVDEAGAGTMAIATTLAYPVGDLLLILLVAGVFGLAGGRPGWTWGLLGAGLLVWGVADTEYLLQTAKGSYVEGTLLDSGWTVGAMLIAVAAWRPEGQRQMRAGSWSALAVPAVATLAAGGVLVVCSIGEGRAVVAVALAGGAVCSAMARTFLTLRDAGRLAATRRLAHTDELTGLPNRRALMRRVEDAIAEEEPVALLLLDLDHFKELNDTLGHHMGDVLLRLAGRRIAATLRPQDVLARLGGDEFAIVLELTTEAAVAVADRVAEALEAPFELDGVRVQIDASIGIALHPEDAPDAATLLRNADVAMYDAKRHGGGARLYSDANDHHSRDRLAFVTDLRTGIGRGELVLHLQPQIAIGSGALVGAEALVRWQHPELGLLAPGDFLPAVAQTNVMRPLTRQMVADALDVAAAWRARGRSLAVSVNVAAHNLLDPDFPGVVAEHLARTGVPARQLTLEVTEDAVMSDSDRAEAVLSALRALGVRLSLDDFGTGQSSLARLIHLPVDELKIDRSFVQGLALDPRNAAVVRAAVTLGHELGLDVVAEGIETPEALATLTEAGCDLGQGFLFARPLPAAEFERWAAEHHPERATLPVVACSTRGCA
jgi:diguanylate cyclase (GGDEF)-like protein